MINIFPFKIHERQDDVEQIFRKIEEQTNGREKFVVKVYRRNQICIG